jgi:DNA primase catalytic core
VTPPNREELAALKARVDLVELIRQSGLDLKKKGKNWLCHCPFHEDGEASLSINGRKGLWNCFGCEAGGDHLRFLQLRENLEFPAALERLRALAGDTRPVPSQPEPEMPKEMAGGFQRAELLERVIEHYQKRFRETSAAQQYCNQRGLDSRELWDSFRLGYCDGSLLEMLPAEGPVREALTQLGVLNEKGREAFRGCLVVPLSHPEQGWVGLYGRRLDEAARVPHQYLPGPHRAVFNWQTLQTARQVVISESVLDALSCWRAGITEATCVFGVNGVPEDFEDLLKRYGVEKLVLALDGDKAGQAASKRLAQRFSERGFLCLGVDLPDGQDPNLILKERGPEALQEVLRLRQPIVSEPAEEPAQISDTAQGFIARFGATKYQVWPQPPFTNRLRARLRATREHKMVMDVVDFYVSRSRKGILNQLVTQLEVPKVEAERHLEALLEHTESWVAQRKEQEAGEASERTQAPEISPEDRQTAMRYLQEPGLMERILLDMAELGYIGEENSKLLGYLISVSRKLEKPLSGVVLSQSGAGKSSLTDLVEMMTPPEDVVLFSRISPQALYWMPRDSIKRKLLILEERTGGEGADYSIRVLQSRQKLTQAVVIKEPATGKLVTKEFVVEGPIAYLETTTEVRINHENATRCFEIVLDESAEQTRRIQGWQRIQRLPSRQDRRRKQEQIRALHHNVQRLLEPVLVFIPYVEHLSFPSRWLRTRRDNERFLCLIEAIAFLHQHQRERGQTEDGSTYIMANLDDYRLAYQLAKDVLATTLHELSREAKDLFDVLLLWAEEQASGHLAEFFFTRRDVRQLTDTEDHRLRQALQELVDMEYLDGQGGQGRTYHYRILPSNEQKPASIRDLTTPEELERRWK